MTTLVKASVGAISPWYRAEDQNAPRQETVTPYLENAKKWDQGLYWNGEIKNQFWTDSIDLVFKERIEIKESTIQHMNGKKEKWGLHKLRSKIFEI